ncbi:MAG: acyl-ACP--UDP-N-acetylglucosamine O-acyltransferase [Fidelibacterota bacterium]
MTIATAIHPTAVVDSSSAIGSDVHIGAYTVIQAGVEIGEDTWIGNHATLCTGTHLGKRCKVMHGAVIGEIPQDLKFGGEDTRVVIGDDVTIREFITIHRGTKARGETEIGDQTYLMAYVHVAHDCFVGDHVILTNAVQLGGHAWVGPWATVGGMVAVHQFCRIGEHAYIGGGFRAVQDVPPYIVAAGEPLRFSGINSVGLKRRGFSDEARRNIKRAYRLIYQSSMNRGQALKEIESTLPQTREIQEIIAFVKSSKRGLI